MKIKRFDKLFESFNDSHFTISDEDIEDICTEMIDEGFKIEIKKRYISYGEKDIITEEPISKKASSLYEIYLSDKKEEKESVEYWNGGVYFQDTKILKTFNSILNRFSTMFSNTKVLWSIRAHEFIIRFILPKIETEVGFDSHQFSSSVSDWADSFETPSLSVTYGTIDKKSLEFTMSYSRRELDDLLENSKELRIDNKSDFDGVLRSFERKFSEQAKNVTHRDIYPIGTSFTKDKPVEWSYEFEENRRYQYQPKSKGIFSKKQPIKEFIWYDLIITYEIINN